MKVDKKASCTPGFQSNPKPAKGKLFAGPWVGEFGWELFCWQGVLRHLSRKYEEVIVAGRPGHEILYEDFAEYIPVEINCTETNGPYCEGYIHDSIHLDHDPDEFIPPQTFLAYYHPGKPKQYTLHGGEEIRWDNVKQDFVSLKRAISPGGYFCDIVFHARDTDKFDTDSRNWSKEKWRFLAGNLVDRGYRIGCIGTVSDAFLVEKTVDFRGISLHDLSSLISGARLVIGPSSGPLHFAGLCETPRLVWDQKINRVRHEVDWNPFNVKTLFIEADTWDPPEELILETGMKFLDAHHS